MAVYNPTVAEIKMVGTMDGQTVTNRLYFDSPAEWTEEHLLELAAVVASWFGVDLAPLVSLNYVLNQLVATSMAAINSPQVIVTDGLPLPGTDTHGAAPNNCALSVSLKTGSRGKSGRGRFYLGGIPANQITASRVAGTYRTAVAAKFNELRLAVLAANARMVVYSTVTGGAPRPTGIAFPVQACEIVDDVLDSQRRRLPGRGI